jgi:site-specific recombinase XerD
MTTKKKTTDNFWALARGFLHEYMPKMRRLSPKSVEAYKASLESYVGFLTDKCGVSKTNISYDDFSRDHLKKYITWMHDEKHYAAKTVNLRITAIKTFLKYSSEENLSLMCFYTEAKSIKGAKEQKKPICYLSRNATKALLSSTSSETAKGRRNRMLLILLYESAARVQEIADLMTYDLHIDVPHPFVTLTGKGQKTRTVPLTEKTVLHLKSFMREFHEEGFAAPLFFSSREGKPHRLSVDSISLILKKAAELARVKCDEIPDNIHCHLIRKTRAMDLYREGISLPIVMQILGHENISTTSGFYAFATMEMMYAELEKAHPNLEPDIPLWKEKKLLETLCSLD